MPIFLQLGQSRGRSYQIFPKQTWFYFPGPESLCKISSKSNQNCGRRSVYRQTDWQTQVIL